MFVSQFLPSFYYKTCNNNLFVLLLEYDEVLLPLDSVRHKVYLLVSFCLQLSTDLGIGGG